MRSRYTVLGAGVLLAVLLAANWTVRAAPFAPLTIYADALANGWEDWSWATTLNFNTTSPVHGGTQSISVHFDGAWAGLYLHADPAVDVSGYDMLRFWIHGGSTGNQHLRIVANGSESQTFAVTAPANTWQQVDVTLAQLGSPATLTGLYWQDTTGGAQAAFYLDDIQLINTGLPTPIPTNTPAPSVGPALSVNAQADVHAINPDIYGMNFADEDLAAEIDLPVRRWGGNATTRYNWQYDISNRGLDWYFENVIEDQAVGPASDHFIDQDKRTGTESIITVPLIGWTPKNDSQACGFSINKYGAQTDADWQWRSDCGNGIHTGGAAVTGNDPLDTSTAISPIFVANWIDHLIGRYGTAANGGVKFYNLDNEPMLWNSTHRDVHPQPTSYDELRDKTYQYAAAIKAADPSAQTLGPVLWGWTAYWYSALDAAPGGSWWENPQDRLAHGNLPFVVWYLQQMRSYEQQHGTRLLDYLDLHYYPQASGVALSGAGSSDTQARRLRSTRSLWDPAYADESWIDGTEGGPAVRLIPRMKAWVANNYPGTKLAITEYNWGALDHINGAVAQADVLGIFGREGLDLATLWGPPSADEPGAFAFRLYRNYDGAQHAFGETSVQAVSADQDRVAIYAAKRGVDNALTLIVINKSLTQTLSSAVTISGYVPFASAPVYRYSAANLNAIVRAADQPIGPGTGGAAAAFTATLPAASITLIELRPNVPLDRHVYLPLILKP